MLRWLTVTLVVSGLGMQQKKQQQHVSPNAFLEAFLGSSPSSVNTTLDFSPTPAHVRGQHLHLDNFVLGDHQGPQVLSNAAAGGGAVFCLPNLDPFGEQSDGLLVGPESLEPQSKPVTQMVEEKGLKVM